MCDIRQSKKGMKIRVKVYFKTILMNIKSQLEYRKAFIVSTLGSFLITFFMICAVYFLFMNFNQIGDWNFYEVGFLFGISYFNFSLAEMFLRGLDHFDDTIRNGEFDRLMIRPQNLLIQSISMEFDLSKLGRLLQSALIIVIALCKINVDWTVYKTLTFIFINIGCFIIFFAIFILKATFCFWTINGLEFMNILSEGGKRVAQYPINIYEKWFRLFFTYIVPFGIVNYFPVMYLFGKSNNRYYGLTPLGTVLFLFICIYIWKIGVKHYESTGS